uniref:Calcium binding protein 1 n=2 Tax=Paracoccidioides brasiliensis TaxID=121759 RepID=Q6TS31_PARBR|nr:calcium binding protein 1 [Paracoccidioides brasiliensis]
MQFSKVIAASFSLLGAAVALPSPQAPSPNAQPAVKHALGQFNQVVTMFEKATAAASCNWITCLESLAASSAACAAALGELGLDIPLDLACIASAASTSAQGCEGCF